MRVTAQEKANGRWQLLAGVLKIAPCSCRHWLVDGTPRRVYACKVHGRP